MFEFNRLIAITVIFGD